MRRCGPAVPDEPQLILPGLARTYARNSGSVLREAFALFVISTNGGIDCRDRSEVVARVPRQFVERRQGGVRAGGEKQRVAVGVGTHQFVDRDRAAGAGLDFDEDGLSGLFGASGRRGAPPRRRRRPRRTG